MKKALWIVGIALVAISCVLMVVLALINGGTLTSPTTNYLFLICLFGFALPMIDEIAESGFINGYNHEKKKQKEPIKTPDEYKKEMLETFIRNRVLLHQPDEATIKLQEQQQLIIKRLEATPMPKAKFKVGDKVIWRWKSKDTGVLYRGCPVSDILSKLATIKCLPDWTMRYSIEVDGEMKEAYEHELTSLDDYAKEQKKK